MGLVVAGLSRRFFQRSACYILFFWILFDGTRFRGVRNDVPTFQGGYGTTFPTSCTWFRTPLAASVQQRLRLGRIVDGVQIGGVIPLGRRARGHVDQAESGQVVEIFPDALCTQAEFGRNSGHARPTLPRRAVRIALQHVYTATPMAPISAA